MAKSKFTFYIINEPDGTATPKLMSSNGKVALNERCKNSQDIHNTWNNLRTWIKSDNNLGMDSMPMEVTRKQWEEKFTKGPARNAGPKKVVKKKK